MRYKNPFIEASLVLMLLTITGIIVTEPHIPAPPGAASADTGDCGRIQAMPDASTGGRAWSDFENLAGAKIIGALARRVTGTPHGMEISFYVGPHGHVRNPVIECSSGDPALDHLVAVKILPGLQLPSPPPSHARACFVMRVSIMQGGWVYALEPAIP